MGSTLTKTSRVSFLIISYFFFSIILIFICVQCDASFLITQTDFIQKIFLIALIYYDTMIECISEKYVYIIIKMILQYLIMDIFMCT